MSEFRRLVTIALLAGAIAGGLLAALQIAVIGPLIATAEAYERAAVADAGAAAEHHADAEEWEPTDGFERIGYTVLGTILTGIAYAAIALSVAALLGIELNLQRGLWLGLAGCACFAIAPAIGLPPKPPGVAGAEVHVAQTWWAFTALVTAAGLALFARAPGTWPWRLLAAACLLTPHILGAPRPLEAPLVPQAFVIRFAVFSVLTQVVFWMVLGAVGGLLSGRMAAASAREV